MSFLQTVAQILDAGVRLLGLVTGSERKRAQERFELLHMQRLITDAIARHEIDEP